jgi:hypothetical protein
MNHYLEMDSSSSILSASSLGLIMSGSFISCSLTLSGMGIPALLVSHPTASKEAQSAILANAARSWEYIYDVGKKVGPIGGVIGSVAYAYAAYALPPALQTEKRLLYAAAVANSLVGPFTVIFMTRTNSELIRRSDAAKTGSGECHQKKGAPKGSIESYDTPKLLARWSRLNASRSIFPAVAAGLAVAALVSAF